MRLYLLLFLFTQDVYIFIAHKLVDTIIVFLVHERNPYLDLLQYISIPTKIVSFNYALQEKQ
jgi:hypothetical protein